MKNHSKSLILAFSLAFFVSACGSNSNETSDMTSHDNSEMMSNAQQMEMVKAPNFEVTTLNGEMISLQKSLDEGKPVVVYFTASWCPTCAKNWTAL